MAARKIVDINLSTKIPIDETISTKNKDLTTIPVLDAIKTISMVEGNAEMYGSFNYKALPFPSDIDLIEEIAFYNDSMEEMKQRVTKGIVNIVKYIRQDRGYYFSELKAGLIEELYYDIGDWDYIKSQPTSYSPEFVKGFYQNAMINNLITKKQYMSITDLIKDNPSLEDFQTLQKRIRDLYILRWNQKEVIDKKKKIFVHTSNAKFIKLEDCVLQKTHLKIDMITAINNRFIEVTNFFVISNVVNGIKKNINLPGRSYEFSNIIDTLKEDIEKHTTGIYTSPIKMLKRMWSLCRLEILDDRDNYPIVINQYLEDITPILRSPYALFYQIKSELSNIGILLESKYFPIIGILRHVVTIMERLTYVIGISYDESVLNEFFKGMIKSYNPHTKKLARVLFYRYMNNAQEYIENILAKQLIPKLESLNLFPPPSFFLPGNISIPTNVALNNIPEPEYFNVPNPEIITDDNIKEIEDEYKIIELFEEEEELFGEQVEELFREEIGDFMPDSSSQHVPYSDFNEGNPEDTLSDIEIDEDEDEEKAAIRLKLLDIGVSDNFITKIFNSEDEDGVNELSDFFREKILKYMTPSIYQKKYPWVTSRTLTQLREKVKDWSLEELLESYSELYKEFGPI